MRAKAMMKKSAAASTPTATPQRNPKRADTTRMMMTTAYSAAATSNPQGRTVGPYRRPSTVIAMAATAQGSQRPGLPGSRRTPSSRSSTCRPTAMPSPPRTSM